MSSYHFSVGHVSRGAGQSATASAAYISGEKLYSEYYGEYSDYTRKGGVIYTEIMLPDNAPGEFSDRETLWNSVENTEKNKRAQLAYNFNIALQNELSLDDNLDLARAFVMENFVSRGMICDLALHAPEPKDGGIANPHFHVLVPMRPLKEDGSWDAKQHREYRLDENGERIRKANGEYDFTSVPTTDWGCPETLREWRHNWAVMVNKAFEEKGIDEHVDERSYEAQGINLLPTIHEGPAVRAMEKKGKRTRKGDYNRWIKAAAEMLRKLREELESLKEWLHELNEYIKEESHREPTMADYINEYFAERNRGAYSQKARINNLKEHASTYNFLTRHKLSSIGSMEEFTKEVLADVKGLVHSMKDIEPRMNEIKDLLKRHEQYTMYKPFFDKKFTIRNVRKRDSYEKEHRAELTIFNTARRILKESHPEGKIPNPDKLRKELEGLEKKHDELHEAYMEKKAIRDELFKVKRMVDSVHRNQTKEIKRSIDQER